MYGFSHGEYLPTLLPGWIHVSESDSTIVRECWRRYHAKIGRIEKRGDVKRFALWLLGEHHNNQELYHVVMTGRL